MEITKALKITWETPSDRRSYFVRLACGFKLLRLQTFLSAHLQQSLIDRKVALTRGRYGNLSGTPEENSGLAIDRVAIAMDWPDLDARLAFRSATWGRNTATGIVATANDYAISVSSKNLYST